MGYTNHISPIFFFFFIILALVTNNYTPCKAQLSPTFYDHKCPNAALLIRTSIDAAVFLDRRMAAALIRLYFHDCFVQGCDASIFLLDDPSKSISSERNASPNKNSVVGYEVIEAAKFILEKVCPGVVSCADIIALAARYASEMVGGPTWTVKLGRRDSTTASPELAESNLPGPQDPLDTILKLFNDSGLGVRDVVALSGAHTIGHARCIFYRNRIYSNGSTIDANYARMRRLHCPLDSGDAHPGQLDWVTPKKFDNNYYKNLIQKKGLLESDQVLFSNGGFTASIVHEYSNNASKFNSDFAAAMVKLGDLKPLVGDNGVIRKVCSKLHG